LAPCPQTVRKRDQNTTAPHHFLFSNGLRLLTCAPSQASHILTFFQKLPPCPVGIEAYASSHHWSREFQSLGHKNDAAGAEARSHANTILRTVAYSLNLRMGNTGIECASYWRLGFRSPHTVSRLGVYEMNMFAMVMCGWNIVNLYRYREANIAVE
jgi:hypothetical protein